MPQPTILNRPLKRGYVQCTACEHWCAVAPGEAGKCGVRRNIDGQLQLMVYGRAIAVNVDPVEKKPLYHFLPGRAVYSLGTAGCNLFCAWCQNWQISQLRDGIFNGGAPEEELSPTAIVAYCDSHDIPLIAFTYNEPTVFFEYAYDTAQLAHKAGIRTIFVSSGFETVQALDTLAPYLDAINIDLKAMSDVTYRHYCGARLAPVLRNIEHVAANPTIWLEVTTLVIPDLNDSDEELGQIADFLAAISPDIPWHVSAFTPRHRMTDRPNTPAETLHRAWGIGKRAGLHHVYTGNIWNHPMLTGCSDTNCPGCGETLIRRAGYRQRELWTEPGICHRCATRLAGVWS